MSAGVAGADGVAPWRTIRTLPIHLDPLPDESLDSWLEALASQTDTTWGDVLHAVGIDGSRGHTASYWAMRACVSLTPQQVDTISWCTGVEPGRLRAMTLQPWINNTSSQRPSISYLRVSGSRFCPQCLHERSGRWRVWWRLRWAFACPVHACLLADACCVCGGLQRTAPPRSRDFPQPGLCFRSATHAGGAQHCGGLLSTVATVHVNAEPVVAVQRELLRVLRAGRASFGIYARSPVPAGKLVRDLHTLGQWMLRHGQASDMAARISDPLREAVVLAAANRVLQPLVTSGGARATGSGPASDAAIACLALPVLQADNIDAAAARLQWLTSSMRRRGVSPSVSKNSWRRGQSASLDAARLAVLSASRQGPLSNH